MPAQPTAPVDHVVINVLGNMDAAVGLFRALGFTLTDRGYHSLGSINHLMMFPRDYLELVGIEAGASVIRREVADSPMGLNGLVFKTGDADACHRRLTELGIAAEPPLAFSRPVMLQGRRLEATFRTVRLKPGVSPSGRVYFCEHRTPELVWRPELLAHANGTVGLGELVLVAPEPAREAALFETMLSLRACHSADESSVALGAFTMRFMTLARYVGRYGSQGCDPAGRDSFMGALVLRTASLAKARECLAACAGGNLAYTDASALRLTVGAGDAFQSVIEFVE